MVLLGVSGEFAAVVPSDDTHGPARRRVQLLSADDRSAARHWGSLGAHFEARGARPGKRRAGEACPGGGVETMVPMAVSREQPIEARRPAQRSQNRAEGGFVRGIGE